MPAKKRVRRDYRKEAQSFFVHDNRLDFERIVAQIMYTNPSVFVNACVALGYTGVVEQPHWYKQMTEIVRAQGKIPAIKFIREKSPLVSLMEAKTMVDEYLGEN